MAKIGKIRNISMGTQTATYRKTGVGAISKTTLSGSALTEVDAGTYALSGLNDKIDAWFDAVTNEDISQCRIFTDDARLIRNIICNGTPPIGSQLVGYSDTERGKAKAAVPTYATPATPTVAELKTAVEIAQNAKWNVDKSSAGFADVTP